MRAMRVLKLYSSPGFVYKSHQRGVDPANSKKSCSDHTCHMQTSVINKAKRTNSTKDTRMTRGCLFNKEGVTNK